MKSFKFLILIWLVGCIQTDLEDPFAPTVRIDNAISEIDFRVSGSYALSAIYTDDTGEPAEADVEWESSNESVLSFQDNIATVHDEGAVTVTVRANGISDSHTLVTQTSRGSLVISGSIPIIQVGNSSSFKFNFIDLDGKTNNLESAQWSSSDENVATIDDSGIVTAINSGTTIISVLVNGIGQTTNLEVTTEAVSIDPSLRLLSFAQFLSVGEQFQFTADLLASDGTVDETAAISWSSSDASVLSLDENGLATANTSGSVVVTISSGELNKSLEVTIEGGEIAARSGSLMGIGYDIEGDFTLEQDENGDFILTIMNYRPDGPGPYFYFTNQNNNINNGLKLGVAGTAGNVTINVSQIDPNIEINTYNYLMVWCEPFNVRLGVGAFEN